MSRVISFFRDLFRNLFGKLLLLFSRKKPASEGITVSEWLALLRTTALEGFECEAFHRLKEEFPASGGDYYAADGGRRLSQEMAEYANTRIAIVLDRFQEDVVSGLRENDEMIIESAFRSLQLNLGSCMFFRDLEGFPRDLSEELSAQITDIISKWQTDYGTILRNDFATFPTGTLGEELLWLYTIRPPVKMLERENRE